MAEQDFTRAKRALQHSQNDTVKRIEKLEARLTDLDTNLADPSNSCKERKKLRFVKGRMLQKLELEQQNLLDITNAMATNDYQTILSHQVTNAGLYSPCSPVFHLQSPPMSPFMPFPMSPLYGPTPMSPGESLYSPASPFSYFPGHTHNTVYSIQNQWPGSIPIDDSSPTSLESYQPLSSYEVDNPRGFSIGVDTRHASKEEDEQGNFTDRKLKGRFGNWIQIGDVEHNVENGRRSSV